MILSILGGGGGHPDSANPQREYLIYLWQKSKSLHPSKFFWMVHNKTSIILISLFFSDYAPWSQE